MQNVINKVFRAIGEIYKIVTGSAYSQARQKIKPEVFSHLNKIVCEDYYQLYGEDGEVKRWRGHRLLGMDGTYLNLPDTEETRAQFTIHHNQTPGSEHVQAMASVLYDLCNDIGIDGAISKIAAEKNLLFQHLLATQEGDVIVMDRNFADYIVMATMQENKRDFIIRFPHNKLAVVNEFWESDKEDIIVNVNVPQKAKPYVKKHNLATTIKFRLVKVVLSTGEIEVLGTSLLDCVQYPRAELKQVYGWRWNNETYYDRIKNIFELERFSGTSVISIKQDFYGVIFLATLESILIKPAQTQLSAHAQESQCCNEIKVNRALSYVSLVDHAVELLCDKRISSQHTLAQLEFLFKTNSSNHRSNRKVQRDTSPNLAAKLYFNKYVKRIIS